MRISITYGTTHIYFVDEPYLRLIRKNLGENCPIIRSRSEQGTFEAFVDQLPHTICQFRYEFYIFVLIFEQRGRKILYKLIFECGIRKEEGEERLTSGAISS